MVKASEACRRLTTIPGVGHLTELAVTTAIDDPERFRRHRGKSAAPLAYPTAASYPRSYGGLTVCRKSECPLPSRHDHPLATSEGPLGVDIGRGLASNETAASGGEMDLPDPPRRWRVCATCDASQTEMQSWSRPRLCWKCGQNRSDPVHSRSRRPRDLLTTMG
jgi:hypothetical protein